MRQWVLVSSTGKVSDGSIRNLEFNLLLHQKLISVLELSQGANAIDLKPSQKKKKSKKKNMRHCS